MNIETICALLERAIRAGGERAKEILPSITSHIEKGRGDFATEADLASESEIFAVLRQDASDIPIVSEETGLQEIPDRAFFCVDPFDGTIIASRGCSEWGVCGSYIEDGKVLAAVHYQPIAQRLVSATRGGGCFLNGEPLLLPQQPLPERFVLSVDVSYASNADYVRRYFYHPLISDRLLMARNLSCAVANAYELLAGQVDIYVGIGGGKIWDYSAASLLVEEAGGVTTTLTGEPLLWNQLAVPPIFARNLEAVRQFLLLTDERP